MFLVAVMAMGASGVFATGKPAKKKARISRQDACDRAYANTRGLECPRNAGGGGHLEEIEQSN
jgi:hypothetical protein